MGLSHSVITTSSQSSSLSCISQLIILHLSIFFCHFVPGNCFRMGYFPPPLVTPLISSKSTSTQPLLMSLRCHVYSRWHSVYFFYIVFSSQQVQFHSTMSRARSNYLCLLDMTNPPQSVFTTIFTKTKIESLKFITFGYSSRIGLLNNRKCLSNYAEASFAGILRLQVATIW